MEDKMKKILERIESNTMVSRKDAIEVNELTDGELFIEIPKGAFTQLPSKEQYEEIISFIKKYINKDKCETIDIKHAIVKLKKIKDKYDVILNQRLYGENNTVLTNLIVMVDDTPIKFLDLPINKIENVKSQLISVFGNEIELNLNKLIATNDILPKELNINDFLSYLIKVRDGWFDMIEEDILTLVSKGIDKSFMEYINKLEDINTINGLMFMVSILNSNKCRKDLSNAINYIVYKNKNRK